MSKNSWNRNPLEVLRVVVACTLLLGSSLSALAGDDSARPRRLDDGAFSSLGDIFAPRFSIHGFADVSYHTERTDPANGSSTTDNSFSLGELDLYIVSQISERFTFLGEIIFEVAEDQDFIVDIERLTLRYTVSDALWFTIGRDHTPLGYWNETFHHGLVLQPTISRPSAVAFEDDGGMLPIHGVGVIAGGRRFWGDWSADYRAGILNGRAAERLQIQNQSDGNSGKAAVLRLSFAREAAMNVRFGPMVYFDRIPEHPSSPERAFEISERIVGAHLTWEFRELEFIGEIFQVHHENRNNGDTFDHDAYYGVLTWNAGRVSPYFAFDRRLLDPKDLYFEDLKPDLTRLVVGLRYDFHSFNAFKLEYQHSRLEGETVDAIALQIAFSF